ncbi:MAG: ribosomal protein S18-alanine N-acetyltransferase [Gammaproteobacteria bacterium]|jgi:ribosomal-protein-alanine N-acetyltransferase
MSSVLREITPVVRHMLPGDLMAVSDIERRSYEFPWSRGIFRDCLLAGYLSMLLEADEKPRGYGILSVAAGEAHLLNLCIDPDWRRRGFGELLLSELIGRAREASVEHLLLEVRPSNEGALRLYRKYGFRPIGRRSGYYRSDAGREDAMVLALRLQAAR